jgi:LPS-assembly lipoprotein
MRQRVWIKEGTSTVGRVRALGGELTKRILGLATSSGTSGVGGLRSAVRACGVAVVASVAVTFGGCGSGGFQPLHATGATGGATAQKLAGLDVAPIPGRVGQRIRNELVFDKSASGVAAQATKRVEIKLTESLLTTLADFKGDSAGQSYQVEAVYRVVDIATSKVESEGRSIARANFERFESIYANVRGREDAENRAARQIANDLKTRLAVHLSRG